MMKTSIPTVKQQQEKKWYVVNAEGHVLGHLATRLADILRGKNKVIFTPHMDVGDHVIVLNAAKIVVTGTKQESKIYYHHTAWQGHLSVTPLKDVLKKRPLKVLREAVFGMLPKNRLRADFIKKLHLYEGTEHEHEAQKPIALEF